MSPPTFGKRGASQRVPPAPHFADAPEAARRGYAKIIGISALTLFFSFVAVSLLGKQSQSSPPALSTPRHVDSLPAPQTRDAAYRQPRSATPTFPVVTPETLCKERYRLDLDMRDTCVRMQETAKLEVTSMQIDDDVKVLCAKRYIHDWSMYVTCAKLEMAGKQSASAKPDRPRFDIVRKCEEEWPDKKNMQDYCIRKQEAASARASGGWIEHRVAVNCTGQYPHDWNMFMYCVDNQSNARNRTR